MKHLLFGVLLPPAIDVTFELHGDPKLSITSLIGHVFLAKKLDYEVTKVIVISVRLQCERVKSSMLLDLKIINENDEPPIFNEPDGTIIKDGILN